MKITMAKTVENHLNYYNFLLKRKNVSNLHTHHIYVCVCMTD